MRSTAFALLASALPATAQHHAPVRTGLDLLVHEDFAALRGRTIGLVTNHTARSADGRRIVDLFLTQDACELRALFSPEHGFDGVLDQARIQDAEHTSGLRIFSLYGETRKPTAVMLRGLDTLVFDIQDIGCRFYTYVSTMVLAMEAAKEHGLRFFVLDRPNPINGVDVAGPVLDAGRESFTACHTIAIRHGMTAGELALMVDAERAIGCDLHVIPVQGWQRAMFHDATGLDWIDPSPNMRNPNQALLYPGIGLLETTNLSVGRGTDTPFEWIGAPWLDGGALARALNAAELGGVRFVPIERTPRASVFAGELCSGVHILITDRARVEPLRLGITIATELRRSHRDQWHAERYAKLLGDQPVLDALLAGAPADAIEALWQDELAEFRARRAKFLLYETKGAPR
jgi:uncharacterized protein YbbC (DUF1343 family)